ncbi:MAG: GntR family transcriptional regulator [Actinobacteria bacterium]|nr:GntR family transcriptional regulator [Actinomycetota bacterium]
MAASNKLQARALDAAVYQAIRDRIVAGELRPGDPLVEAQLSSEFGISKTPVREALIALGRDGLVDQVPYHVTRVATPRPEDIRQVCQLRTWLEGEIAVEGAVADDSTLVAELTASVDRARRALDGDDLAAYVASVNAFSDMLLAHSGNRFAVDVGERLRNFLALMANIAESTDGRRQRSIEEHAAILDAIAAGDPAAARTATGVHMRSIERDALQSLARQLDEAGERA